MHPVGSTLKHILRKLIDFEDIFFKKYLGSHTKRTHYIWIKENKVEVILQEHYENKITVEMYFQET